MSSSLSSVFQFYKDKPSYIKSDFLSGTVVALALIPEAIAFSIIAGVDPAVGLYASFCIAVVIAFAGGRPAMISAATGAMALVIANLVKDHGLQYLLAATVLTGIFQIIAGYLQLGKVLNFVSKSVMTGFVNALAILIFMAQLPELTGINMTWQVYAMVGAGLAIIYGLPYITKAVPSPLIAIIVLTIVSWNWGFDFNTVGEMGAFPDALPTFLFPDVPLNLETFMIILPYALTLTAVGLLESLMTAVIVDDLTDTESDKDLECKGQGIANIVAGFFGGMAGCAMIGQSVINVKSGGRGRLSTLWAGIFLLILILILDEYVKDIPMPALVAVMIMVSIGTFDFSSVTQMHKIPKQSTFVMLATVAVTVYTHDLAQGVLVGVLLSGLNFAYKVSHLLLVKTELRDNGKTRHYNVMGQVFFASSHFFISKFDLTESLDRVVIDMSHAHFWDQTGVAALDKVVMKFRREGAEVEVIGANEATRTIIDKFALYNKDGIEDIIPEH